MSEDCRNCLNEVDGICARTDSLYFANKFRLMSRKQKNRMIGWMQRLMVYL